MSSSDAGTTRVLRKAWAWARAWAHRAFRGVHTCGSTAHPSAISNDKYVYCILCSMHVCTSLEMLRVIGGYKLAPRSLPRGPLHPC